MPPKTLAMLTDPKEVNEARRRRSPEVRIQIEILELRETRWDYARVVPIVRSSLLVSAALGTVANLNMTFESI